MPSRVTTSRRGNHCGGGPDADEVDLLAALDACVELQLHFTVN